MSVPLLDLHCTNCGTGLRRKRRYRVMLCPGCVRARDAAFMRELRAEQRRTTPPPLRFCAGCHSRLESNAPAQAVYCRPCAADRRRESLRLVAQRSRAAKSTRVRLPNPNDTPAGGICARARADGAICRGKCRRRCTACGQLYQLTGIETPCPNCQDHLIDNPLEVSRVA